MKFGEYLRLKRTEKNLKSKTAAEIWKISPGYLSSLENGSRPAPSFEVLKEMAETLQLDVKEQYLLYDLAAENKKPPQLSTDLAEYVCQTPLIRETLRYSMQCQLTEKEWTVIYNFIRHNYIN